MMTYFEVKGRLEDLKRFRGLYREYIDFTNRETNLPAQMVRRKMEPMVSGTVDSLRQVRLGRLVTRHAPAKGGGKVKINIIRAIFREPVRSYFMLDDHTPLEILDRGINVYRRLLWRQKVQLFNPLFWLLQFAGFLADLPFFIFRRAGYDTMEIEKSKAVRAYRAAIQILALILLAKWSGLIDWIWFDILGF